MKSVPAIAFDYRPSRGLLFGVLIIAGAALAAIVFCGLAAGWKFGLAALAAVYAGHAFRAWLRPPFVRVVWHSAGHWRLHDARGGEQAGEFAHAVTLGVLIVLVLKIATTRTAAFVLLPDNCDAETRRRLRVRLARADSRD